MADFIRLPEFPVPIAELAQLHAWSESDLEAIEQHGMLPLVYRMSGAEALRESAMRAAAVEELRLTDLREVLAAIGGEVLIVKGTALAYTLYPAPDLRPRCDTDILIERERIDAVRRALTNLGFDETLTSGDSLGVRQHSFSRTDRFGVTHVYDIHLAIANNAVVADALTFGELLARSIAAPALGPNARVPCSVDALLHACIHRVVHHHDSNRMIWLYDIHLLRERMHEQQHEEFWRRARERGVLALCRASVEAARRFFGGAPLPELGEVAHEASSAFLEPHRRYGAVIAGDLAALPGWRARLRRLRELAFPPAAFMLESAGNRSRAALPWLYARRGLRSLVRLFRPIA
jgi:hypothetical protein